MDTLFLVETEINIRTIKRIAKIMEMLFLWVSKSYSFDMDYEYAPSTYPIMVVLSFIDSKCLDHFDALALRSDLYEIEAKQLENTGAFYEALLLHQELFIFYFVEGNEKMSFHLRKALDLAFEHQFPYPIADMYPYYGTVINPLLETYPPSFVDKIKEYGMKIHQSFSSFSEKQKKESIFSTLSNNEIKYILYTLRGCSYKQVAELTHVTERTVANRYATIYEKLGLHKRKDFLDIIESSLT